MGRTNTLGPSGPSGMAVRPSCSSVRNGPGPIGKTDGLQTVRCSTPAYRADGSLPNDDRPVLRTSPFRELASRTDAGHFGRTAEYSGRTGGGAKAGTGFGRLGSLGFVYPILGNEFFAAPIIFQGILKPALRQIGMIADDYLHLRSEFSNNVIN